MVCTNSTKQLGLHWSVLTLSQLSISSLCGFLLLRVARLVPYTPIQTRDQLKTTALLAAVFAAGFITLNSALGLMHVPPHLPPPRSPRNSRGGGGLQCHAVVGG